ncbi:hypothetical protein OsJ_36707 [Oryza sativa Japonica Group]|uniref:Uncharacterized protein n=1 Tax=Oryza sativa subsp. japonica TaxID=39947 RepID=B9GE15_ORYSJ|nr:hypothetical protein OsJ_36707 [Oryza sativa Japonica Group]
MTTLPPRSDDAPHELFIFSTSRRRTTTSPPRSDDALPVEPEREAASEVGEHERLGERCAHHVHQRRRRHEREVRRRELSRRWVGLTLAISPVRLTEVDDRNDRVKFK